MKKLLRVIVCGVFFLPFLFDIPEVQAVETYQSGSVIFADDFTNNFDKWSDETGNGGWSINAGNLLGLKFGKLISGRLTNANTWDNYSVEVDVNNNSGIDDGVGFRRTDGANAYELTLRHGTGWYQTPEVVLRRFQNGQETILKDITTFPLVNGTWYHVKIEVFQEHIQVWIDNSLLFELTDTGTTVKTGGVSLAYWTGDTGFDLVRFDNVKVTSISKNIYPVIFIAGLGGSELKLSQDTIWSKDNGHGGTYSHAYGSGEKVWVNQDEAIKLGDDDYFDVLKLKADGQTSEAPITPTGSLTTFGYGDIDPFFQNLGYTKGTNYFIYAYDWRKDLRTTQADLDLLIDQAKQRSNQPKVNIVAHSMGGLVARYYISDPGRAAKINKLIELGVPHLGAPITLKTLIYGTWLARNYYLFQVGIPPSETRDLSLNYPGLFQLLPSGKYFDLYNNTSASSPYPIEDDRDIDADKITGPLNYAQTKSLLANLSYNQQAFSLAEQFHNLADPILNQTNGIKIYNIVGTAQPTLGQIRETWWITWPIKILPKKEELFINGDDTVPLYSASLKSDSLDLSGGAKIYYTEQKHTDLVNKSGPAMQTVKAILNEGDAIPVEIKDQKISLEGQQVSVDQNASLDLYDDNGNHTGVNASGEVETNIPNTYFDTLDDSRHLFIKKSAPKVTLKVTPATGKSTNAKIRRYIQDKVDKTTVYNQVQTTSSVPIVAVIPSASADTPVLTVSAQTIAPTSEVIGSSAADQTQPTTKIQITGDKDSVGNYTGPVTVTLTGSDSESGVSKIEYSLDNGVTVKTYTGPFTISTVGTTTIQVKATDKSGNEELPQTTILTINTPSSVSANTTSSDNPSQSRSLDNQNPATIIASIGKESLVETVQVLGTKLTNPLAAQTTSSPLPKTPPQILGTNIQPIDNRPWRNPTFQQILLISVVIAGGLSLALGASFFVPTKL